MDLRACYDKLEGNYEEVLSRLRTERLVEKFVLKFLNDGSYALLEKSMKEGNHDEAFRAAHTLKGVCQNLSFTRLYDSSSRMTESLRMNDDENTTAIMEEVQRDYNLTIDAISEFK